MQLHISLFISVGIQSCLAAHVALPLLSLPPLSFSLLRSLYSLLHFFRLAEERIKYSARQAGTVRATC